MRKKDTGDASATARKMKFSIKDLFSKCDQIRSFLKKSLMENFIFCVVCQGSFQWGVVIDVGTLQEAYTQIRCLLSTFSDDLMFRAKYYTMSQKMKG